MKKIQFCLGIAVTFLVIASGGCDAGDSAKGDENAPISVIAGDLGRPEKNDWLESKLVEWITDNKEHRSNSKTEKAVEKVAETMSPEQLQDWAFIFSQGLAKEEVEGFNEAFGTHVADLFTGESVPLQAKGAIARALDKKIPK